MFKITYKVFREMLVHDLTQKLQVGFESFGCVERLQRGLSFQSAALSATIQYFDQ